VSPHTPGKRANELFSLTRITLFGRLLRAAQGVASFFVIPPQPQGRRRPRSEADGAAQFGTREVARMFAPPQWLQDLGLLAWFLVGVGLVLFGLIWILGEISTIVSPVVSGTIIAAVAGPAVSWLQRSGFPRAAGAGVVLLLVLALAVVVFLLVAHGIVANGDQIKALATGAADKIEGWANDAGIDGTSSANEGVQSSVPEIGETLLKGVAGGISGLTSIAFFLSFTLFSTFFLLKDGPTVRRFVNRHLGIPVEVANVVTGNMLSSLRRYFLGVSVVAAFNAIVVGIAAWVLGVPLAGTIAVVTLVTAYVPFIGAVVSGAFAVILALASEGTEVALVMFVVVLLANGMLQNVVQPIAFGATLDLNPLAVLVLTIAAGCLFGMVGLVLAAPIASAAVHISRDLARARAAAEAEASGEAPPVPAPAGG
jgi:predicted PurR-regulated permease PerM